MTPFGTIAEAVAYTQAARAAVHEANCPVGAHSAPCDACPPGAAVIDALDILRAFDGAKSTRLPARLALHDAQCYDGPDCDWRETHALRHTGAVTQLRRYVKESAT